LNIERLQARILGIVQGVGFRPFVYRLAKELELSGWIRNDESGVTLEVEGPHNTLLKFLERLHSEKPSPAFLYAVDHRFLTATGMRDFSILESESKGSALAWILPDLAVCDDCRRELLDPNNRRFRYPFINCTHCGTRYTIIQGVPYDRPLTSMKEFPMCDSCSEEYHHPENRRFHAQPNACAACGPQLEFRSPGIHPSIFGEEALKLAEEQIRLGKIIAVKGIGGFHLVLDARNQEAVLALRNRKRRQMKPFAVLYPDLASLKNHVEVSIFAETMLQSAQAPILLLPRKEQGSREIAPDVAPRSPYLGVFLPYSPLHILLTQDLGFPVVATSANFTDEPITFSDRDIDEILARLCDGVLTHNRAIVHQADDSVLHLIQKPQPKPQMLRRARGYTPLPMLAPRALQPMIALGGHLNSTFALTRNREIILSPHLGDMENYESRILFQQTLQSFLDLYKVQPDLIVHDLHPDYFTTRFAQGLGLSHMAVQHHHAHMAACMLENQVDAPALALTWDGTGYGTDGTIWGGEFLSGGPDGFQRVATLLPFRLPGGESAIHETWRTGLSLLWETFGNQIPEDLPLFSRIAPKKIEMTLQILERGLFSPVTTSMGRLFDGVSAILGLSYYNTHQAESAQMLEYAAWENRSASGSIPVPLLQTDLPKLDWRGMIREIVGLFRRGTSVESLAATFHQSVAEAAMGVIQETGMARIVMAGGVFCNRFLTERLLCAIERSGRSAYVHSQLPPTDGSLAVGQIWVAANRT
jgi:hydrogenase maturation protein HypF